VSIKVLFLFTLLSLAVVIGVAAIVGVRIWWQMKTRRAKPGWAKPESSVEDTKGKQQRLP
jgi:uncharacterized membrane protein YdfJ with MMPL/SSD domain